MKGRADRIKFYIDGFPPELRRAVKKLAAGEETTMRAVFVRAVKRELAIAEDPESAADPYRQTREWHERLEQILASGDRGAIATIQANIEQALRIIWAVPLAAPETRIAAEAQSVAVPESRPAQEGQRRRRSARRAGG